MTSTATNDQTTAESHVVDSEYEGGSPDADFQADGAGEDLDIEVVGQEPGAEEEGSAETPEPAREDTGNREVEDLRAEHARLQEQLSQRDAIIDDVYHRMEADPELKAKLSGNGAGDNITNSVLEAIDSEFVPESGAAIRKIVEPLLGEIERLKETVGGNRQHLRQVRQQVGTAQFREQLGEHGVTQAEQASSQFQVHMKRLRGRREFQSIEARSPRFAAEMAANSWRTRSSTLNGNRDDRRRVETAKRNRGASSPSRGSSTAEKIIRIKREGRGGHVDRAGRIRLKAEAEGKKPPRIEYID